jgi:transcription elongation factor Elf1
MRAGTKNQKRVIQVDRRKVDKKDKYDNLIKFEDRIKPIGKRMIKWAENNVLKNYGFRYKSGTINCLKCGHHWQSDTKEAWHDVILEVKCPSCKNQLKVHSTNKRTEVDSDYFSHVTKAKEYQLIRTWQIKARYKCKQSAEYSIQECIRIYIGKDGKREVVAKLRGGGYYSWLGNWRDTLELRDKKSIDNKYAEEGLLYPKWDLHDYAIRCGFNAYTYAEAKYTVSSMLHVMLTFPHIETIVKANKMQLYSYCHEEPDTVKKYWSTIKICIRNNYDIGSPRTYFDMINAMNRFKKDLRNPHYVCPKDLRKTHDYWINKSHKLDKKLQKERAERDKLKEIERMKEQKELFELRMKKFSDLNFTFGNLKIAPFKTLDEVKKAGELMHHCIYKTTSYWDEPDNLLLGSYFNGKLIETSQYSLRDKSVYHSYGVLNKPSKHHKKIIKIIQTGKHKITECLKPKRKARKVKLKEAS